MAANEPLGTKLRRLRRQRGITLTEFAIMVGVSRPTVWSWETGRTEPRPQKRNAVAEVLNLAEDELILSSEEAEQRALARSLEKEITSAKEKIAKLAGTSPEFVDIVIKW